MLTNLLVYCVLCQAAQNPQPRTPIASSNSSVLTKNADSVSSDSLSLVSVKRIYVDSFGEDPESKELQSMIVSSLVATKRFRVTENKDRADAILKGTALEKTSQEVHAYGESTSVGSAAGGTHGEVSGTVINGTGTVSGSSSGGFAARHMGTSDSSLHTETVDRARISIRLVDSDGDVIWTTTQESKGAKYKGASAEVADMCVKQLVRDVEKMEKASSAVSQPETPR